MFSTSGNCTCPRSQSKVALKKFLIFSSLLEGTQILFAIHGSSISFSASEQKIFRERDADSCYTFFCCNLIQDSRKDMGCNSGISTWRTWKAKSFSACLFIAWNYFGKPVLIQDASKTGLRVLLPTFFCCNRKTEDWRRKRKEYINFRKIALFCSILNELKAEIWKLYLISLRNDSHI